jgi:hypothetical protein
MLGKRRPFLQGISCDIRRPMYGSPAIRPGFYQAAFFCERIPIKPVLGPSGSPPSDG